MTLRVVHANFVRPPGRPEPEALLEKWPTLGQVAKAVSAAGAKTVVVQSFHRDAELCADGVRYLFVAEPALPGRASGMAAGRMARAAAAHGDIVHVNGLDFPWHTRRMCASGRPVLVQDHASGATKGGALRRWGLAKAAGIAFTDAVQAEPFIRRGSLPCDVPIFSVPECSTRFSSGDREAARAETGVWGDPAILWVGRLNANKDPMTILAGVERAASVLPGLRLWCCYEQDDLLVEVRARIQSSPILRPRVALVGSVPHARIEAYFRAADFFMLASRQEGSGYALIEALACGAIPIVSDIPSFRRLAGPIGACAPVGDAAGFAEALVRLAAQPHAPMRAAAARHFGRVLSFPAIGARLCEIYAALLVGRA